MVKKDPVSISFVRSFATTDIAKQFIDTLGGKDKYFIIHVPVNALDGPYHDHCPGPYVSVVASMETFRHSGAPE